MEALCKTLDDYAIDPTLQMRRTLRIYKDCKW